MNTFWGAPSMQQRMAKCNAGRRRFKARAARSGCRAAARAPEGVCAGIFVANRSSARAARRERRRGPTAGAAGLRRAQCVEGTARGSGRAAARGPVFRKSRRPRGRFQFNDWSRMRVPMQFLELCEWFRDCS